jgi:hypothetical protein
LSKGDVAWGDRELEQAYLEHRIEW